MSDFQDAFAKLVSDYQGEELPRPTHEGQIARLRETYDRYEQARYARCVFNPGDLVTPLEESGYSLAGEPHVVLEVATEPYRPQVVSAQRDIYTEVFCPLLDVRVTVLCQSGSRFVTSPFWMESWRLVRYEEKSS